MSMQADQLKQTSSSVLILAYHYPPSNAAGAVRPFHFTKYLRRNGYDVKVLTASEQQADKPDYVTYVKPPVKNKTPKGISEMVLRKYAFPYDDGVLWAMDVYPEASRIVAANPGINVFSTFPPINTHLAALALKRKYGVHWIADFRDPLANSPVREVANQRLGHWTASEWVDKRLEKVIFRDADVLIANSDTVAAMWRERYPEAAHKIHHIWNGFDSEEKLGPDPLPERDHKLMVHVGVIYHSRHPGMLLASMDRLINAGLVDPRSFRLRLIGTIEEGSITDQQTFNRLKELGCLEIVGAVPKARAVKEVKEADYLLLLDVNDADAGQQVPSKMFEYIRIGRPIISFTPLDSPTERILKTSGIPNIAIHKDMPAAEVDRRVLEFLALPTEPSSPSPSFLSEFDAEGRVDKLMKLLNSRVEVTAAV